MLKSFPLMAVVTLSATFAACGASQQAPDDVSQVHFITFGPSVSGLVSKVKKPRLRACLSGVNEGQRDLWTKNIESTIMKWVEPLRQMTSDRLTAGVDVVTSGSDCDTEIRVAPGTHSNTSIGQRPVVRMSPTGYFAGYNVLLHEFGHAFALSDTYQGGQSGNCKPGQPQAVMCNTSFADVQSDDVKGLQEVFKRTFPSDRPGEVPPENSALQLNVALGAEAGADRYKLHLAVEGAEADASGTASYCLGTRDECEGSTAVWRQFTANGRRGDLPRFSLPTELSLSDGLKIMLRYQDGDGSVTQAVAFEQI